MKGLTLALASLAILIGGPAQAATLVCTTYASVAKQLAARHQETVIARGLAADGGHLIEVFASPDRGTFTIVMVMPDAAKKTCMLSEGMMWDENPISPPVQEGPTP